MGCISQNGCLGPRRRQKDVFAELVELIYAEADKLQGEDSITYGAIRGRMSKRGLLRKLLDHLLSHKNKISDCLNYNLRIVSQSNTLQRKLTGLVVVDEITTQIYRVSKVESMDDGRTLAKTGSSQGRLLGEEAEVKMGADLRFDLAYFRLVLHLLQTEKEVLEPVLSSIVNFCNGRKERFGCRAQVWRTLQLLLQHLQAEGLAEKVAKSYLMLLELLKEGGKEESTHQGDLLVFLRLWQREQEKEPDSASEEGLQVTIFKIIKLFVGRCLSAWDAKVLFRSLFQLYEDERFPIARLARLEEMVLGIVRESDLHTHIMRGLFLYLLQFLSAVPVDRTSFRGSFNEQFEAQRYPHIYDRRVRLRLFETLRRWGERGYISLDESVTYGSTSLVSAYTSNLRGEREYVQEVVRQFFRLSEALSLASNFIVVGLLLDQIRQQKTEEGVRRLLVNLAREVLESRKLMEVPGQDLSSLLVPIAPTFSKDTRIDLIQLMGFVVRHLTLEQLTLQHEEQNPIIGSLCQLFLSLHEGAKTLFAGKSKARQEQGAIYRYQYTNAVLSFLKCFIQKYAYLHVLCFISAISDRLGLESDNTTIGQYFDLYLIYEAMHMLNPKHKVPDRIVGINFKISPSAKSADIRQEIQSFMNQVSGTKGELFPQLRSKINKDITSLRQFAMLSENDFKQMQLAFLTCFKSSQKQEYLSIKLQSQLAFLPFGDTSRTQFKRQSLNGSLYQSYNHQRSRNDQDESFKDIVQRIIQN